LNKDGSVDEILVYDPHDDRCLFHLEQMDDHYYWMRAYGVSDDLVAHIGATIGRVHGEPILGEEVQPGKKYSEVMFSGGKRIEIKGWEEKDGPKVWSDHEWEESTPVRKESS
jgi:hypothetical protein